ncbi:MAG: hypothetical protein ABW185_22075 [Sedimenticola sp.]
MPSPDRGEQVVAINLMVEGLHTLRTIACSTGRLSGVVNGEILLSGLFTEKRAKLPL